MRQDLKAAAGLIAKFPARPPSANQNAARLRDNQRRHRARVKTHIAELEARLAETTARLEAALEKITYLTGEVESLRRCQVAEQHTNPSPASSAPESRAPSQPPAVAAPSSSDHTGQSPYSPSNPIILNIAGPSVLQASSLDEPDVSGASSAVRGASPAAAAPMPTIMSPSIRDEQPRPPCSSTCNPRSQPHVDSEVYDTQPDILVVMMSDRNCKNLPAPQSGESTTPCVDAYKLIEQQNFSGLDVAAITSWLRPGFRKAAEKGGGCRVDTQLLFALLDHISSSSSL